MESRESKVDRSSRRANPILEGSLAFMFMFPVCCETPRAILVPEPQPPAQVRNGCSQGPFAPLEAASGNAALDLNSRVSKFWTDHANLEPIFHFLSKQV